MDKYLDELKNKIIAEINVSNIENIIKENDDILKLNDVLVKLFCYTLFEKIFNQI